MAATKVAVTIQASASCAAGGSLTSSTATVTGAYSIVVYVSITTGSTAPTVACTASIMTSPDNINWYQRATLICPLLTSTQTALDFELPPATQYCYVSFGGNTGAAVTCQAQVSYISAL